jgi:Zn-dependent M16 (insulinase) family peptidase
VISKIIGELKWVQEHFFSLQKSIVSITANEELIPDVLQQLPILTDQLDTREYEPVVQEFVTRNANEGIAAPIKIQYVIKGGNFFRKGYSYSGKLRVLSNILSNEFLYKELRVKGGAYGGGASFGLDGYQYFYSYRDPNLKESLETYNKVPDFIRNFQCGKRDMDKYILGEISAMDYPKTPEATGAQADRDYITGFSHADRQQIRDEVLSTNLQDLRQYADMVQAIMNKNHYAVMGNEAKIKESADAFDIITPIFKSEAKR